MVINNCFGGNKIKETFVSPCNKLIQLLKEV